MAKAKKKRWGKARKVRRVMVAPPRTIEEAIRSPLPNMSGRPKAFDIGPTEQTVAKLSEDTLAVLVRARILSIDDAIAAREIADAWDMLVSDVDDGARVGGRNHLESAHNIWLEAVWRRWCAPSGGRPGELYRRCQVTPGKVVDWIKVVDACDLNPKGAAGVLHRALVWWQEARVDVRGQERLRVAL